MAASAFAPPSPKMPSEVDLAIDQYLHSDAFDPSPQTSTGSPSMAMKPDVQWPSFWNDNISKFDFDLNKPFDWSSLNSSTSPASIAGPSSTNNSSPSFDPNLMSSTSPSTTATSFSVSTPAPLSSALSPSVDPNLVQAAESSTNNLPAAPTTTNKKSGNNNNNNNKPDNKRKRANSTKKNNNNKSDVTMDESDNKDLKVDDISQALLTNSNNMAVEEDEDEDDDEAAINNAANGSASPPPAKKPSNGKLPHIKFPVPEYDDKPSLEEYKKLSSKEKRQLRNKISARNFRHRRKEYITQLEEEVAKRDTTISDLREEVETLRVDNKTLRSDLDLIKSQWETVMAKLENPSLLTASSSSSSSSSQQQEQEGEQLTKQPVIKMEENDKDWDSVRTPSLSPASSSSTTFADDDSTNAHPSPVDVQTHTDSATSPVAAARRSTRRQQQQQGQQGQGQQGSIPQPNVRKDVFARRSSAWGPGGIGSLSRDVGVHTTFIPDFALPSALDLEGKPSALDTNNSSAAFLAPPTRNLNPRLDGLSQDARNNVLPAATGHIENNTLNGTNNNNKNNKQQQQQQQQQQDFVSANNPYFLNTNAIDDYRTQLYQKLGHNIAGALQAKKDPSNAFPVGFRPAFFASPMSTINTSNPSSATPNSALLSGKTPQLIDVSPFDQEQQPLECRQSSTPSTSTNENSLNAVTTTSHIAGLAISTLVSRLTSSFFDAFAGQSSSSSSYILTKNAENQMNPQKVADVLAGRAELQVVSKEVVPQPQQQEQRASYAAALNTPVNNTIDSINEQLSQLDLSPKPKTNTNNEVD